MAKKIYFFSRNDKFFELSNFSSFDFRLNNKHWRTMEHYYQAMKFDDVDYFNKIANAVSPKQAKDLGQTRRVPIKKNWEDIKEEVMYKGLKSKFENPELIQLLLRTGKKELIENSPYDNYWGIGKNKKGKNRLGVLLMKLREELKKSQKAGQNPL
ncbi:NADAR family protein [Thalassomonas haliotis]|uniref:NADAR family protein n=1 Tax=Thalassomonas haliotis TaxID=485448 RepID=A0ABY7VDH5_9GAMM|nr:NADAR family protein [Thalassomonas haliotis]WDE11749.1 NADAR family protein [Thalassomonas haliotis]